LFEKIKRVPSDGNRRRRHVFLWLLTVVPVLFLECLYLVAGDPFSWSVFVIHWVFVAGLLRAARWIQPCSIGEAIYVWPWSAVLVAGVGTGAILVYTSIQATSAAWILLIALYLLLLGLDAALTSGRGGFWRWGLGAILALAGGVIPVAIAQIESHFADEEFFVALQSLALCIFWGLLLGVRRSLARSEPTLVRRGLRVDRRRLAWALILLVFAGLGAMVRAYQRSFYPPKVPAYEGISPETPFLCGRVQPDPQTFDGEKVFHRLLARVEANPHKEPPEYGLLALGAGERHWAQAFRKSLLSEAAKGRFTGPAHSVKSVQYEAALRAYYLPRVHAAFPGLFSDDDWVELQEWFVAINRRVLTVEWVDWMYALALTKWPEGPYENQENGAGLLALLESGGLAAPDLSSANRDYLERNWRGWIARFRNTDDAFFYQPEWINNAYFQSLYGGEVLENNARLSFEWLLLQALPDGTPLRYNHPVRPSLASIAYLGAYLLEDPRYVWLAGRALTDLEARGGYLSAQPGIEAPVSLTGRSPTRGSCLLYGNSGLPNQAGPLAPDKIVFRDRWSSESAYLLLNLRFTGWHRYKGTNTITQVYQNGPLADDELEDETFNWLPTGRSMFRDKRIPRENLNGLLVERTGMSAILYTLTGIGGPWAQDPPYYAQVIAFETGDELDWTHTRLEDWRGWQHDRWVYFYHDGGPIVVVDEAEGPSGGQAALAWHLIGEGAVEGWRIRLRSDKDPTEVLFVPIGSEGRIEIAEGRDSGSDLRMIYYASVNGTMRLVTMFLPEQWAGAEAEFDVAEQTFWIAQGRTRITLSLRLAE
jgi:hypothetical protein